MGCILLVVSLVLPRVAMFFIWLMTDWFNRAYDTWLWPLLGFFFMPYTTLAYMAAMVMNAGGVRGLWMIVIILAALVDIGHWGGGARVRRPRRR
mgnify:CR=1 FL=1